MGSRAAGARLAMTIQGVRILEALAPGGSGIDAPILSRAELAVRTGWSLPTAGTHLKAALAWSMKTVGRRPAASGQAMKLRQLRDGATVAADDRTQLVDSLASMDRTDPAVQTVLAVAHPVFSYGPLTHLHWVALLGHALDVDRTVLGLSARTIARLDRELDRAMVHVGPGLLDRLDQLAAEPGPGGEPSAADQYAAARATRDAEAAARKAEIMRAREEKKTAVEAAREKAAGQAVNPDTGARRTISVPLPSGFDGSADHRQKLIAEIEKRTGAKVMKVRPAGEGKVRAILS